MTKWKVSAAQVDPIPERGPKLSGIEPLRALYSKDGPRADTTAMSARPKRRCPDDEARRRDT